MVNYIYISVLFTGIQKEKAEAHYSVKVHMVGRDRSEGSEFGPTACLPKMHAGQGERLAGHQSHAGVAIL